MLFTRTASEEALQKDFSGAKNLKKDHRLSQLFIDHARSIARLSRIPLVVITSSDQRGSTFGERFANAIQNVLERGYQNVISIGNDCLSLSPSDLKLAKSTLASGKPVVGQSTSGGAYLIGVSKKDFQQTTFEQLSWNSSNLFESLKKYFTDKSLRPLELSVKVDVNHSKELSLALREIPVWFAIRKSLETICFGFFTPLPKSERIESSFTSRIDLSRAPPSTNLL
ncbi:DUF2064 domain-containing protein [Halocola ammonii]